jgi:hypothetical protein
MSKSLAWGITGFCIAVIAALVVYKTLSTSHANPPAQVSASSTPHVTELSPFATYVNVRFAFSVCYPPSVFTPKGEAQDGDGQQFVSQNGQATAYAYGSNSSGMTLAQEFAQDAQTSQGTPITITSKTIEQNEFTFTGFFGPQTFVERTLLQNQQFKTLNIQYPTAASTTYGPFVQRMMQCFTNTGPTQYSNP